MEDILLSGLSKEIIRQTAINFVASKRDVKEIFELLNNSDPKVAWRSAWLLENIFEIEPSCLMNFEAQIFNRFKSETNYSICRHLSKIIAKLDSLDEMDGDVLDRCFELMSNPNVPVAVRANCISIVERILPIYPEIKTEFKAILEGLIHYESPGFKSRAIKIIKKL